MKKVICDRRWATRKTCLCIISSVHQSQRAFISGYISIHFTNTFFFQKRTTLKTIFDVVALKTLIWLEKHGPVNTHPALCHSRTAILMWKIWNKVSSLHEETRMNLLFFTSRPQVYSRQLSLVFNSTRTLFHVIFLVSRTPSEIILFAKGLRAILAANQI